MLIHAGTVSMGCRESPSRLLRVQKLAPQSSGASFPNRGAPMESKRLIIEYALARDAMYRAARSEDDRVLDAATLRLRQAGERLWDLGHRLAEEEGLAGAL